jgi:hypothetical protein
MHNIEKSIFRRGEYIGYCGGVWRIVRLNKLWFAYDTAHNRPIISTNTLKKLSLILESQSTPFESTIIYSI